MLTIRREQEWLPAPMRCIRASCAREAHDSCEVIVHMEFGAVAINRFHGTSNRATFIAALAGWLALVARAHDGDMELAAWATETSARVADYCFGRAVPA